MHELQNVRQIPGEGLRRWFSDSEMDLIIWENHHGNIQNFQLCYGKGIDEHAFTWRRSNSYSHEKVDDGERTKMGHKSTPILVPDGKFDPAALANFFAARSQKIDSKTSEFVGSALIQCSQRS